ncbi:MAG: polyhydroxyalkanoate synthesis repressor PhaR [Proteobacteria bacterium]|nr:polyhydroxyalkanoate synthesis repressor PhaR [Pseudomonadota bacterium]MDA1059854.1 polyhydroxyalkanoate synthesis repressor PhaR [Pseudomonadota bacterium]
MSDTPSGAEPTVIKKYANRRLYNTAKSAYVTLDDLAEMVKAGEDFVVRDAKTGDDLTRQVLTQIILDQEGRGGNLLPLNFLRKLIGYYGQNMGGVLPGYLDASLDSFQENQDSIQKQFAAAFGQPIKQFEEITRQNMAMFERAMGTFKPFANKGETTASAPANTPKTSDGDNGDIDALKKEIDSMRVRLDKLAK